MKSVPTSWLATPEKALRRYARLLDLTNRNRLLNYLHRITSSLRFIGIPLNDLFQSLLDGQEIALEPVPEPRRRVLFVWLRGANRKNQIPKVTLIPWGGTPPMILISTASGAADLQFLQYLERLDTTYSPNRKCGTHSYRRVCTVFSVTSLSGRTSERLQSKTETHVQRGQPRSCCIVWA